MEISIHCKSGLDLLFCGFKVIERMLILQIKL